jgi:Fe-S cluster biogenesis protein NfuA
VDESVATVDLGDRAFDVTGEHQDGAKRITALLEVLEVISPVVEADGGSLNLLAVDVATGVVQLQLAGACGSCAVAGLTLNDGVDRIIKGRLDWVTEVVGSVEESDIGGLGGWTPKNY